MTRTASQKTPTPSPAPKAKPRETNRDFVEQVAVAFILAFLVRGFAAEAFVIPTGSMAPTLVGRHKEVDCPQCGASYTVNASDEVEGTFRGRAPRVETGICYNCRYQARIDDAPSFKGDRILVMKFLYSLPFLPGGGGPERWDVVVFKYPEEPETNYIKRLVGLPGEVLRIHYGDIWTKPLEGSQPFTIRRKPLEHLQAMQIPVYDDRHRPRAFDELPAWRRWRPDGPGWAEPEPGTFAVEPRADGGPTRLRYANLVPDPIQWSAALAGRDPGAPRASLITDFYSYNTNGMDGLIGPGDWHQPHWVGDLSLTFDLDVKAPSGTLRVELVEGGVANWCDLDLAKGQAVLAHAGIPLGEPAPVDLSPGGGPYEIRFANVDNRLTLLIDGEPVFGDGLPYDDGDGTGSGPTAGDLRPVSIEATGAAVAVSGLALSRDIYYTQRPGESDYGGSPWEIRPFGPGSPEHQALRVAELFDRLADSSRFAELADLPPKDYPIHPGYYMMMGDNSPRSKDGRGWGLEDQLLNGGWDPNHREYWEVPQNLLIGKAFFVYWPHGKPFGPDIRLGQDFRVPFRPYWERMRPIR